VLSAESEKTVSLSAISNSAKASIPLEFIGSLSHLFGGAGEKIHRSFDSGACFRAHPEANKFLFSC
jgi:hypothetical protein